MAVIQVQVGTLPNAKQTGGQPNALAGYAGELLVTEALPPYYTMLKAGKVFYQVATAVTPTVFVGGAAGIPLIGLYNPVGSGVDAVLIATRISVRTTGTAAVTWDVSLWGGVSVLPSGTVTVPINGYSQQNTGSACKTFVNTAMTGSSVLTLTAPILSGGLTAATAITNVTDAADHLLGNIVAAPGVLQAIGQGGGTMTASVFNISLYWAELPA